MSSYVIWCYLISICVILYGFECPGIKYSHPPEIKFPSSLKMTSELWDHLPLRPSSFMTSKIGVRVQVPFPFPLPCYALHIQIFDVQTKFKEDGNTRADGMIIIKIICNLFYSDYCCYLSKKNLCPEVEDLN